MNPQFSLFDLLILLGIIQGIITSILLLNSKKNIQSNKLLALALLSFCFLSTKPLLHTFHLWETNFFRFFPNGIELALSPLIYFYIKSLVTSRFRFKPRHWIHFIPFLLAQIYAFIVYFSVLRVNDFNEKDSIAQSFSFDFVKQSEEYLLLLLLPFYLFYSYKELMNYKKWLDNTISDSTFPDFSWLKNIFKLSLLIGLFLLVNHFLDIFFDLGDTTVLHYNLLNLFIAFMIYYLGLKGYLQPDYTFSKNEIATTTNLPSKISDVKFKETVEQLQKVMDVDKVFLYPKLTIRELSYMINIPQRDLSHIINQYYKLSFRDFINQYRLEDVKSKLKDENYSHMSILGIALESGFNSEASFYRIFKKNTGVSPKEFIQQKNNE
ncbi:helix-turn-helix domain-containing protein [Flavobacteriaceae bacterium S356]|uniref:Helix-turn-helix domain-containing protein n=1 Tax=Asprobacillus argus TaxID=3076534 RepID=A0ABU3LBL0_9FLAO|nr:helix-turn-helix domain-containing protein [Flavobacteriaceae bacterium S356]